MNGIREKKVKVTEVVSGDRKIVSHQEVVREASEDERQAEEITVNRFVAHWCGHYKQYGFSCQCGNRFCRACLEAGRVWYCEECGATLGSCCYRKRYDGKVLCPEHWEAIDWKHPAFSLLGGVAFLGCLALALYLLDMFVG